MRPLGCADLYTIIVLSLDRTRILQGHRVAIMCPDATPANWVNFHGVKVDLKPPRLYEDRFDTVLP